MILIKCNNSKLSAIIQAPSLYIHTAKRKGVVSQKVVSQKVDTTILLVYQKPEE